MKENHRRDLTPSEEKLKEIESRTLPISPSQAKELSDQTVEAAIVRQGGRKTKIIARDESIRETVKRPTEVEAEKDINNELANKALRQTKVIYSR
jgi:hypothetical protein